MSKVGIELSAKSTLNKGDINFFTGSDITSNRIEELHSEGPYMTWAMNLTKIHKDGAWASF